MLAIAGVALAISLLIVGVSWWAAMRRPRAVAVDATPDMPLSFGFETSWLAIRTRDTARVIEALDLGSPVRANWGSGLAAVYRADAADSHVFVSPPVAGWTLVVGSALPHPAGSRFVDRATPFLIEVGREFAEVQYFLTSPEVGLYAWARVIDGRLARAFAWTDEGVVWNAGPVTPAELRLRGAYVDPQSTAYGPAGQGCPDEAAVMAVARAWSLDPSALGEADLTSGAGYLGAAPVSWRTRRSASPRPLPVDLSQLRPVA